MQSLFVFGGGSTILKSESKFFRKTLKVLNFSKVYFSLFSGLYITSITVLVDFFSSSWLSAVS